MKEFLKRYLKKWESRKWEAFIIIFIGSFILCWYHRVGDIVFGSIVSASYAFLATQTAREKNNQGIQPYLTPNDPPEVRPYDTPEVRP